jgi:hypothetical protein
MKVLHPNIRVRIFMPGNKASICKTLWNAEGIEAQLSHTAAQIEKNHPDDEYRLVELGPSRFNFVWVGKKQASA